MKNDWVYLAERNYVLLCRAVWKIENLHKLLKCFKSHQKSTKYPYKKWLIMRIGGKMHYLQSITWFTDFFICSWPKFLKNSPDQKNTYFMWWTLGTFMPQRSENAFLLSLYVVNIALLRAWLLGHSKPGSRTIFPNRHFGIDLAQNCFFSVLSNHALNFINLFWITFKIKRVSGLFSVLRKKLC
jgi:hypothetical protein